MDVSGSKYYFRLFWAFIGKIKALQVKYSLTLGQVPAFDPLFHGSTKELLIDEKKLECCIVIHRNNILNIYGPIVPMNSSL